ncbi:flavin reductase [Companilactobacillus sp. RD055328]|uniref:NADPH-dependent FMN reductase n=1 Tax=Companilactobacillus sp. RD055328 TaxID=2916634 RepID=UPI001FC8C967|nr:NAD(P)H-dependent oxidoreductase [Companilactobacillus sp. RD055328]GKQ42982.1 flavin reductase [Companilactobacillus sp. RD055328]
MAKKVAVLVGSLRKASYTKQIAQNIINLLPDDFEAEIIEIGNLPFYNEEYDEGTTPESYTTFRNKISGMDAVIFATPEYNRSVPAVLKNALDVGSRPYGKSAWNNKPAVIISTSIGAISGFGANHHLRQSLTFLNMPVVQQPEAYIGNVASLLNEDGIVTDEGTIGFLQSIVDAFVNLVNKY